MESKANETSFLKRQYITQINRVQPNFDLTVHDSSFTDRANNLSSSKEVQLNITNSTKSDDHSCSEQRRESNENYKKRVADDIRCSANCRTCLIGLLIGLLTGCIALAVLLTIWLTSKGAASTSISTTITSTTTTTSTATSSTTVTTSTTDTSTTVTTSTTDTSTTTTTITTTTSETTTLSTSPSSSPVSNSVIYSEDFVSGVVTSSQCTVWINFVAQLTPRSYTLLIINGSRDSTEVILFDPTIISDIALALRTSLTYGPVTSNSQSWAVGTCPNAYKLSASGNPSGCPNPGYIVKPCMINVNWGGINGLTCSAPNQTMTVIFQY